MMHAAEADSELMPPARRICTNSGAYLAGPGGYACDSTYMVSQLPHGFQVSLRPLSPGLQTATGPQIAAMPQILAEAKLQVLAWLQAAVNQLQVAAWLQERHCHKQTGPQMAA